VVQGVVDVLARNRAGIVDQLLEEPCQSLKHATWGRLLSCLFHVLFDVGFGAFHANIKVASIAATVPVMGFFDIGIAQVTTMMAETLAVMEFVGMIGHGQYTGSGLCRLPGLDRAASTTASGKVLEQLVSRIERLHAHGARASALLGAGGLEVCFHGQDLPHVVRVLPHVVRVLVPVQK
jgi:hypothetical protein